MILTKLIRRTKLKCKPFMVRDPNLSNQMSISILQINSFKCTNRLRMVIFIRKSFHQLKTIYLLQPTTLFQNQVATSHPPVIIQNHIIRRKMTVKYWKTSSETRLTRINTKWALLIGAITLTRFRWPAIAAFFHLLSWANRDRWHTLTLQHQLVTK